MQRIKEFFWPLVGLAAVAWSLHILYEKLLVEAAADAAVALENASLLASLKIIAREIGHKLGAIPHSGYALALLSTLCAYLALAWYDRIALIHLRKEQGISWFFITVCSFATYAISHNIGGSVFSGGMVRYRAYTSKGLSAAEVAVLVALCSFTFAFGTILLGGLVLLFEPELVAPLAALGKVPYSETLTRAIGGAMLLACVLYTLGAWLGFKPFTIRRFTLEYPGMNVVWRQWVAAPLELIGAAGIIYFALPEAGHPGYLVVLGAFLLSFSVGLLFQVPGGMGVMETVFIAVMPGLPATSVFAALLVWRLLYLILPLALSIPFILVFERRQIAKVLHHDTAPPKA